MPMFKPISENEASGKVKEIFNEIKKARKITLKTEETSCQLKKDETFFIFPSLFI